LPRYSAVQKRWLWSTPPKTSESPNWLLDGLCFTGCITMLYLILTMI
jgi:hypothetical protein